MYMARMTAQEINDLLAAQARTAVGNWSREQMIYPHRAYYCYFKASTPEAHGAVIIAENKPDDSWSLVDSERIQGIPLNMYAQLRSKMNRLPLLKTNE